MRLMTALLAIALLLPATAVIVHAEDPAPAEAISDAEIQKLVDQLGHDDFKVREAASKRLAKLGERARAALEKAAKNDGSLEARWRAQQLLRRLGGTEQPKAVDTPEEQPKERPNPFGGFGMDEEEVARLKKMMEGWTKRLQEQFKKDGWGNSMPFGSRLFPMGKVKAPGLELVRSAQGVKLTVIDESAAGADARKTYEGKTLDAVLEANPELQKHPGMAELKAKLKNPFKQLEDMFGRIRVGPGAFGNMRTVVSSNGVELTQDANGATVKITEKDENGEDVTKEYKGKTLDEIRKKHPEIADKLKGLGGITIGFGKPQIFGRDRFRRPAPPAPITPSRPDTALFGVGFETPDELLAMHLGLEKGEGALVRQVIENSQAAQMGIERGDIIVRVDQDRITNGTQLKRLFKQAAQNKGPLEIEVIRRGARKVLSR